MFKMYFMLGLEHIADLKGYDHILFLIALTAVYLWRDRKSVLILVTAFTIGHSVTLALATLNLVRVSSAWVEFLIPVTIFISAFYNFFRKDTEKSKRMQLFKYFSALFFGLIHGLGFSNYLRAILGSEESLFMPLLAFNIGLEIGQIFIVAIIMSFAGLLVNVLRIPRRDWILVISGAAAGISLIMAIERAGSLV